ncbi:MAG TPA: hypothetical protein VGD35_24765, partial [Chitinophaga sp.]
PNSNKERFRPFVPLEETEAFRYFRQFYEDGRSALVTFTSFFWGIISYSDVFRFVEHHLSIRNPLLNRGRLILTMHKDDEEQEHYDLLVLSSDLRDMQPFVVRFSDVLAAYPQLGSFGTSISEAVYSYLGEGFNASADYLIRIVYELATRVDFNLIFAPMPPMQLTYSNCISNPSCGISLTSQSGPVSTAGILTTDKSGRVGFTAALHGIVDDPDTLIDLYNEQGAACVLGRQVYINGIPGTVRKADLLTDSCFIEIPPECAKVLAACSGPLQNRPPYRGENVFFDGITSHRVDTNITETDILLPHVRRHRQAMIYTKPVTNRGDSGAALLNRDGQVLGFNHARTGFNAPIEMAEWVWADSVYNALNL